MTLQINNNLQYDTSLSTANSKPPWLRVKNPILIHSKMCSKFFKKARRKMHRIFAKLLVLWTASFYIKFEPSHSSEEYSYCESHQGGWI